MNFDNLRDDFENNRLTIDIAINGHLKFNICDESEILFVNVA